MLRGCRENQNNFVFVPICPLADLADASDGFSRPTCFLDVPIFAVVFDDTAICRYRFVVQGMGGCALAKNEERARPYYRAQFQNRGVREESNADQNRVEKWAEQ